MRVIFLCLMLLGCASSLEPESVLLGKCYPVEGARLNIEGRKFSLFVCSDSGYLLLKPLPSAPKIQT